LPRPCFNKPLEQRIKNCADLGRLTLRGSMNWFNNGSRPRGSDTLRGIDYKLGEGIGPKHTLGKVDAEEGVSK